MKVYLHSSIMQKIDFLLLSNLIFKNKSEVEKELNALKDFLSSPTCGSLLSLC